MLFSRSLLVIYFKYCSLYMSTSHSQFIPSTIFPLCKPCMLITSVTSDSANPWTIDCQAPLSMNTGVGCHALLQGIFWTQGSNLHLFQIVTHLAKSERCMIRRKGRWNQVTWGMGSCTGRNSVWEKGWANVCWGLALLSPSFLPLFLSSFLPFLL